MDDETKRLLIRVGIDVATVCSTGFAILAFYVGGTPFKRGFFCDDESLKYPYRESTVTSAMLYSIGSVLPVSVIVVNEFLRRSENRTAPRIIHNYSIPGWIIEVYKTVGALAFGACCCQLLSNVAKYSVGRLRPHFFDGCLPELSDGTHCGDPFSRGRYIEDFVCTRTTLTDRTERELRLSFPSGHSSFAMYTMLYGVVYIQARMQWRRSTLLKHGLQLVMIVLGVFTSLSRISDYKHHWSDVLAGVALGSTVAIGVTRWCAKLFDEGSGSERLEESMEGSTVEREN